MNILRSDPSFFESWRRGDEAERDEILFTAALLGILVGSMALSAAAIGGAIALIGFPKVGVGIASGLFGFGVGRLWR